MGETTLYMLFPDPADTPNSPVYYCEMSGVKLFFLAHVPDSTRHLIIVWCNIFSISNFALNIMKMSGAVLFILPKYTGRIFARKLYVCEKYESKFTPDIQSLWCLIDYFLTPGIHTGLSGVSAGSLCMLLLKL